MQRAQEARGRRGGLGPGSGRAELGLPLQLPRVQRGPNRPRRDVVLRQPKLRAADRGAAALLLAAGWLRVVACWLRGRPGADSSAALHGGTARAQLRDLGVR